MPQDSDNNNNQQQSSDATISDKATPPNPPIDNDVSGLKKKNEELLGEKKQLQSQFQEIQGKYGDLERQFNQITEILGDTSPQALENFKSAEEKRQAAKIESDRQLAQVRSELEGQYKPQLEQLSKQLESQKQLLTQKLQSDALRRLHSANQGTEFEEFYAMLNTKFRIQFEESGVDFNGIPDYKISRIVNKDGTPLFGDGGKEMTPDDVMLKIRQGHYGQAIASAFQPWNQSNGGILPKQMASSNGVVRYPRSAIPQLQANDRDGSFAKQVRDGKIEFYDG